MAEIFRDIKSSLKIIGISMISFLISYQVTAQGNFILGSDLSYVNMMEDCGAEYRENGSTKDVYQIFADNGINLVRVRLWHNPDWQEELSQPNQYSNYADVKETIFRAKMAGMKVMLGFHFSDFWCDPGRQIIPKAWEGVANNGEALSDSVYNYEAYRETVPEACALSDELLNDPEWTTDRAFTVPEKDTIINNVWGSCETFSTGQSNLLKQNNLKIYSSPNNNHNITIEKQSFTHKFVKL
jgi:hypothetical protein